MVNRRAKLAAVVVVLLAAVAMLVLTALPGGRHDPMRTAATMTTAADVPFTVTMSPMGPVTFPRIPRRIVTQDANYNDMLVAAGVQHGLVATGYANNKFDGFLDQLGGADTAVDPKLPFLSAGGGATFDKESLYALHADVFHIDPVQLARARGWSEADVAEVARNVGPFFANRFSRDDNYRGAAPYAYYDVWTLADKVAQVYHRADRVAELKAIYDGMVARIGAKLPPVERRPRVGLVMYSKAGFLPYRLNQGFGAEQYRAVGVVDAFANVSGVAYQDGGGTARMDLEGMLAIDPDVLITPFAVLPAMRANHDQLLKLRDDPLGKRLRAVANGRLYPGGTPLQGPLFLLFQVEMAAKQVYPEQFGPYRDGQDYPPAERLFDRAAVVAVLRDGGGSR